MNRSRYLELMGIEHYQLRSDLTQVVAKSTEPLNKVEVALPKHESQTQLQTQPQKSIENSPQNLPENLLPSQDVAEGVLDGSSKSGAMPHSQPEHQSNSEQKPQFEPEIKPQALSQSLSQSQPQRQSYHPCPLCLDQENQLNLVVSESSKGRWYWLVEELAEGESMSLLDGIIDASKTHRREGNKMLSCAEIMESCKDKLCSTMGQNDVLIIVGTKTAKLLLQQAMFQFERMLGQQAEKLWQLEGNSVVVLPSLKSMQQDRLNKKQAWLNIQQLMR